MDRLPSSNQEGPGQLLIDPWSHQVAPRPAPRWRWSHWLSGLLALGLTTCFGYGAWVTGGWLNALLQARAERGEIVASDEIDRRRSGSRGAQDVVPAPIIPPKSTLSPSGTVPQSTLTKKVGELNVVELGVEEVSLRRGLMEQMKLASEQNEQVLVMTTRAGCTPCQGVISALPDVVMQVALNKMRLVKVDVGVFGDELERDHFMRDSIPGFFLLANDGTPKDAIHGGEWGDDIAANIAPVLGPFVRGQYKRRKHEIKLHKGVFL